MSSPGGLTYLFNTAYGVGKAAQDRMAQDFNVELRGTGVQALSIWPGAVKTELIVENVLEVERFFISIFGQCSYFLVTRSLSQMPKKVLKRDSLQNGLEKQLLPFLKIRTSIPKPGVLFGATM